MDCQFSKASMVHPLCHSSHSHQTLATLTLDPSKLTKFDLFGEEGLKTNRSSAGEKMQELYGAMSESIIDKVLKNL